MSSDKPPFLSVIVPVFNEERRIENIRHIDSFLKKQRYKWELIVVDDGSSDQTKKILRTLKKKLGFKILTHKSNQGKGFAIKTGMLNASGRFRLFCDVDLSTPISEIRSFIPHLKKYHIVIGSRKLRSSRLLTRQPLVREYLGKIFTLLSKIILQVDISDFTCGFKCFSDKSALDIFSRQSISRWGFDSEILFIGKRKKYNIKEIPISWSNDPRTKVRFPDDIIHSLTELIQIRLNQLRGLYL